VALDASGVAHPSSSAGPLAAGSYSFRAHYSGDSNYAGATSPCEPLSVETATPGVATTIHDASHDPVTNVVLGTTVHDQATVTGSGPTPSWIVAFTFYSNGTSVPTGRAAGLVALDARGVAHPSSSQGPLAAGSYSFQAHYNGDSNYTASTSACEPL